MRHRTPGIVLILAPLVAQEATPEPLDPRLEWKPGFGAARDDPAEWAALFEEAETRCGLPFGHFFSHGAGGAVEAN